MNCRVCGKKNYIKRIGEIKPYPDFETAIYKCGFCKSYFSPYNLNIYEKLHSDSNASYSWHKDLAIKIQEFYIKKNIKGIYEHLCKNPKYKFVIDKINKISKRKKNLKILEVGCSKGYLTSYFLLKGFDITGVEVSEEAVKEAINFFGNHFTFYSDFLKENKKYDVIFFVGTIGCVEFPIKFIDLLISRLKDSGFLIFNAPNVNVAKKLNTKWIYGTTPPDLTALFAPTFLKSYLGKHGEVSMRVEKRDSLNSLRKLIFFNNLEIKFKKFLYKDNRIRIKRNYVIEMIKYIIDRFIFVVARLNNIFHIYKRIETEYGIYCSLEKKEKND